MALRWRRMVHKTLSPEYEDGWKFTAEMLDDSDPVEAETKRKR